MKLSSRLILFSAVAATCSYADLMLVQGTGTLENLTSRQGLGYGSTNGPVTLGSGIVFTASGNAGAGAILGTGTFWLNSNGTWGENGQLYMGVNRADNVYIRLELPSLATEITAFLNYAPTFSVAPTIAALDSSLNVLESYNLALSAPIATSNATNEGAFRGISRTQGDIKYFEIRNSYIVATNINFKLAPPPPPDPIPGGGGGGIGGQAVPEPTAHLVSAAALCTACFLRRRHRRRCF